MKKTINLFIEQWVNRHLIWKLTIYDIKRQYANHYLGVFWNILQPIMQVAIYFVVFGLGLRGDRGDVGDLPFLVHLISGLFPWLFLSQAINSASSSIISQLGIVTKMKFPSSILITMSIVNGFVNLVMMTVILMFISLINEYNNPLNFIGIIYFAFSSYILVFGVALIMSSLIIIVRDMKNVLQNIIRMFFFLTPIFWVVEEVNPVLQRLSSLNPFGYLVMNYRSSLVLDGPAIYGDFSDHLYFWVLTILVLYVGVQIHYKFKNRLVDYL